MSDEPHPDITDEQVMRDRTFEYCYQRNKLREAIDELTDAVNQAITASYPYLTDQKVAEVIVRMQKLLVRAGKQWEWDDLNAIRITFSQIRGYFTKLKGILKSLNVPFVDRMIQ